MAEKKKDGKRGPRPVSAPAMRLRRILAANVQAYLDVNYPLTKYRIKSDQQQKFAGDSGVSWSSIQRALDPSTGVTLDVIADVAIGMEMKGSELLTPDVIKAAPATSPQEVQPRPFEFPVTTSRKKRQT